MLHLAEEKGVAEAIKDTKKPENIEKFTVVEIMKEMKCTFKEATAVY